MCSDIKASSGTQFVAYPNDYLFGVLDEQGEAQAVVGELAASGVPVEDLAVFSGEEGALRIDAKGEKHGLFARLVRLTQAMSMDSEQAARYEQEARAGHCVVAVHADGPTQRDAARAIIKQHHGHFINWYGRLSFETLDP